MRPYAIDLSSSKPVKAALAPGAPAPPGVKLQYLPRIRCNDCPGKLYTAAPGRVIADFEVHLRNKFHVQSVHGRQQQR